MAGEISDRDHEQEPKVAASAMMVKVRGNDRVEVFVSVFTRDIQPLMHDNIVEPEISESVKCDAEPGEEKKTEVVGSSDGYQNNTREREEQREKVVSFEPLVVGHVMILVKHPKKSVHDVLVCKPRDEFHQQEEKQRRG